MAFPVPFSLTGEVGAVAFTLAIENKNGLTLSSLFFSVCILHAEALPAEPPLEQKADGCTTSPFALPSLNNLTCVPARFSTAGDAFPCFFPAPECSDELLSRVFGRTSVTYRNAPELLNK